MTKENKIHFRRIYKILLSASIIISGICLMIGCAYIYFCHNGFSRQIVADTFLKFWICIPIFLTLLLIVGDIIWELISPSTEKGRIIKKKDSSTENSHEEDRKTLIIKLIILGVAILLIIFGLIAGGYADVLTKAINICTECIGLG